MYDTTRKMIEEFGGYRSVASRMRMKPTTVHSHMAAGIFPAKFFDAFCDLARELGKPYPSKRLFSFEKLPENSLSDTIKEAS